MTSIHGACECPQCKYVEAFTFYACGSGEEQTLCPECGYSEWTVLVIDRVREKAEGKRCPKLTKAGHWMHRRYVRPGCGAFCIKKREGAGVISALRCPPDEGLLAWFAGVLADPNVDPEHSYLNLWDGEKVMCVVGGVQ